MPYLVDSDVIVDLTRGSGGATDYVDGLANAWSISAITCLELLAGARSQRETIDLDLVLSGYRAIPPNEDITGRAYYLMKTYARSHGFAHPRCVHRRNRHRRGLDTRFEEPKALPGDR